MSVTDQPVDPQSDVPSHDRPGLDPQAALELAHELVLVTRATFAQLLPETADRAISGIPGLGRHAAELPPQAPASTTSHTLAMPTTADAMPSVPASVLPSAVAVPQVAVPSVDLPSVAGPLVAAAVEPVDPGLSPGDEESFVPPVALSLPSMPAAVENQVEYVPVPGVESPAVPPLNEAPPVQAVPDVAEVPTIEATPTPHRPQHLSLAMLEEIGFLDE